MTSEQFYRLWDSTAGRLGVGVISTKPLPFGQDPIPTNAKALSRFYRAMMKRDAAAARWGAEAKANVMARR